MSNLVKSSRREKITETKGKQKLIASIVIGVLLFFALMNWGVPLLLNFSLFISNLSPKETVKQTTDTTPLFPPVLEPLGQATNSSSLKVSGFTDSGNTVSLFINDSLEAVTTATSSGEFVFTKVTLKEGQNKFFVRAKNQNGKETPDSQTVTIYYLKNPPQLEIKQPDNEAIIKSEQKQVTITGQTDPGNLVFINDHMAVVNQDGTFSYKQSLSDGDNIIKIKAVDQAGNETMMERKVKYSSP